MSKVILTREQANAIELLKDLSEGRFGDIIDAHAKSRNWRSAASPANVLGVGDLASAMYIGYEIDPEFNVGDWVYVEVPKEKLPNVYQIMNAGKHSVNLDRLYGNHKKMTSDTQHQKKSHKKKQRRWWSKHDRDVWQVKRHDILKDGAGNSIEVNGFHGRGKKQKVIFKPGHFDYMTNIKDSYKIICFAEGRKDDDHGE